MAERGLGGIDAVASLVDPVRRSAYRVVAAAVGPIGRDEVAQELGVGRTLAAFHLDKLVAAGLLEVSYARRNGRTGPGSGRPAKLYQRSDVGVEVSVPPRAYDEVAEVLLEAIESLGGDDALFAAAHRHGTRAAGGLPAGADLPAVLAERGYEPVRDGDTIRLRNCPFQTVARQFPPLVCGMNLAVMRGLMEGWPQWRAEIDPGPDGCCVVLSSKTKKR